MKLLFIGGFVLGISLFKKKITDFMKSFSWGGFVAKPQYLPTSTQDV
jgi:hypothetical protein